MGGSVRHDCKIISLAIKDLNNLGKNGSAYQADLAALLRALSYLKAPLVLIQLVHAVCSNGSHLADRLDSLELFAGKQEFTRKANQVGLKAAGFDILYDKKYGDFMGPLGYALSVLLASTLKPGGICVAAPVCSSWVWISRGTTGRTFKLPLGDTTCEFVRAGNSMVSRLVLIMYILMAKGIFFVIEQPRGSLMERHPRFKRMMSTYGIHRVYISMGDYGASSQKPTWLYSAHECIENIKMFTLPGARRRKRRLATEYIDKRGEMKIMGNARVKRSQAYTTAFAAALVKVYQHSEASILEASDRLMKKTKDLDMPDIYQTAKGSDRWLDARLDAVFVPLRTM